MSHSFRSWCFIPAVAGTVLLTAATFAALRSPPPKASPHPNDPAVQVAEDLDAIAQARFQDTAMPIFGTGRIAPPVAGHDLTLLTARVPAEAKRLARANGAGRDYVVAFLHCAHVPGREPFQSMRKLSPSATSPAPLFGLPKTPSPLMIPLAYGPPRVSSRRRPTRPEYNSADIRLAALNALPHLLRGTPVQKSVDHWLVVMRPVRALQPSCLGCHMGAKRGDTLGVMLYAVSRTPRVGG